MNELQQFLCHRSTCPATGSHSRLPWREGDEKLCNCGLALALMKDAIRNFSKWTDKPFPTLIFCPECGEQHIDAEEWATRPHKTHKCGCGHEWRPFEYPTVGVQDPKAAMEQLLSEARA